MASFEVNLDEMRAWPERYAQSGEWMRSIASILRSTADSAGATGDATSATALQSFIIQWTKELQAEAEELTSLGHNMGAVLALYQSTEILATQSFVPAQP